MTNDSISNIRNLWQQGGKPPLFDLEEFQRKISGFERTIRRRNFREYAAAVLVIGVFGYYAFIFPTLLMRIGCGLVILGTFYVIYQLRQRASAHRVPADLGLQNCLEFQRSQLERQRDALRAVWSWYLLPFLPGMGVFLVGLFQFTTRVTEAAGRPLHLGAALGGFGLVAGCVAIVFVLVWLLNRSAANKLQRQIDELDLLAREPE